jgi:hypothetical protein
LDYFNAISQALQAVAVFFVNGLLTLVYVFVAAAPAVVSAASAAAIVLFLDRPAQARLNFRPQRGGFQEQTRKTLSLSELVYAAFPAGQSHTYPYLTLAALSLWLVAQTGMAAPVPWIGAGMWGIGLAVLIAAPEHGRGNLLWFVKSGITVYALLVFFFRLYLGYTSSLAALEWARWIGSSEMTSQVISTTRGNLVSLLLWMLWFIVPLGYVSLLIQQLLVNPVSGIHPRAGAEEMIRRLRQRS